MSPVPEADRRLRPRGRPSVRRPISPVWFGLALFLLAAGLQHRQRDAPGRDDARLLRLQVAARTGPDHRGRSSEPTRSTASTWTPNNKETAFTVNKVDDPKLVEQLEAQKVKFHAEPQNRWLTDLLSWVLPLLVLVGALEFLLPADGQRRGRHHVVRAQPREDLRGGRRQGELRGRGRRRRGGERASGDRRVPQDAEEIHDASAGASRKASCSWARPAPARRCSRAPSPARRRCRSSA